MEYIIGLSALGQFAVVLITAMVLSLLLVIITLIVYNHFNVRGKKKSWRIG